MSERTFSRPPAPGPLAAEPAASVVRMLAEQGQRWQQGERLPVEAYLQRHPALAADGEAVLDLIDHEWLLRQERGEAPQLGEYLRRFPQWATQIRAQFEVERAIDLETLPPSARTRAPAAAPLPDAAAAALPPSIPGYDVLEELGRGGQSVVFKARQRALDRLVALKLVSRSADATPEERARFRREVEAVAHLEHPHIVQIFDVGEHAGQPYCALEYVAGGTLAQKFTGVPQPPRQAARAVATLARAIHWAHRRGIVHRDLKPGNILLTADGTPKIADFGLAKRLEDATLTDTGHVLGTPSYMAPEQAAGNSKDVGPAADVYALGAILYEMLTGRPPFLGTTPWDIVPQVLALDPVPPTRLQPKAPADLETICLKCLQKEPHKRYASAEALAEDLDRFQVGRPIRARPVGWAERAAKWVQRRPVVAGLTAAVVAAVLVGLVASLVLAGWALRERDRARDRLEACQKADRARVQAQVDQLGSATPEAVPGLLAALKEDRRAVLPRLREQWADANGDPRQRLRACLALLDDDPAVRRTLADWMIEAEDPREVLLVRSVLTPHGAELAEGLWNKVDDPKVKVAVRFRALVALAAFDPGNPHWAKAAVAPDGGRPADVSGDVANALVRENLLLVPLWAEALRPVSGRLIPALAEVFRDAGRPASERELATTLLADYAAGRPEVLADLLLDADPKAYAALFPLLERHREPAVGLLTAELDRAAPADGPDELKERLAKRQASAAVTLLRLAQGERVWPLLRHRPDPRLRSYLIHRLGPLGAEARPLVKRLAEEPDVSAKRALLLCLGEFSPEQLPQAEREALVPALLKLYRYDPDPGLHGAAEWLLRQWQQGDQLREIDQDLATGKAEGHRYWYVNGQGQTLVLIEGGEFLMGSPRTEVGRQGGAEGTTETQHRRRIGRRFALTAKDVTVEQFLRFRKDHEYNRTYSPTLQHPVNVVTWYDAAAYCNWLSAQEGIPEDQWCYRPNDKGDFAQGMRMKPGYLSLAGYRLPTEAEWEFACRAGAVTCRSYGETEELLAKYAWYMKNSQDRGMLPPGSLEPNDLGLFDMLGNAWQWCQDPISCYVPGRDGEPAPDKEYEGDVEGLRGIQDLPNRVLRGGAFPYLADNVRSAYRFRNAPASRLYGIGLRPARTYR